MKFRVLMALCMSLFLCTAHVAAEEGGFYLGASGSYAMVDSATLAAASAGAFAAGGFFNTRATASGSSGAFKVYAGYDVNESLAIEGYYADLGRYDVSLYMVLAGFPYTGGGSLSVTAYGLDLLWKMPIEGVGSAYFRTGYFWGKGDTSLFISGIGLWATGTGTNNNFKGGAGMDFKLNDNFALRTEYEYYHDPDIPVHVLSAGIKAMF